MFVFLVWPVFVFPCGVSIKSTHSPPVSHLLSQPKKSNTVQNTAELLQHHIKLMICLTYGSVSYNCGPLKDICKLRWKLDVGPLSTFLKLKEYWHHVNVLYHTKKIFLRNVHTSQEPFSIHHFWGCTFLDKWKVFLWSRCPNQEPFRNAVHHVKEMGTVDSLSSLWQELTDSHSSGLISVFFRPSGTGTTDWFVCKII